MSNDSEEVFETEVVVFAVILDYRQAWVRDAGGHEYAITRRTTGVDLVDLREGQRLRCVVTRRLPRVQSAVVLDGT